MGHGEHKEQGTWFTDPRARRPPPLNTAARGQTRTRRGRRGYAKEPLPVKNIDTLIIKKKKRTVLG